MIILGVSGGVMRGNQDAAVALLVDGKLVFAQEEERFTREKHAIGVLPEKGVAEALDHAGIDIRDVDYLAYFANYTGLRENLERWFKHVFGHCPPIRFVDHHLAHAASAFYASGFDEAMVFTTDLSGDGVSTTLCHARNGEIEVLRRFAKPQSLGIFYSMATQLLGFRRDNDEYKVMGMAGYGEPNDDLDWLLRIEDGNYVLNQDYLLGFRNGGPNPSKQEPLYTPQFGDRIGFVRRKGDAYSSQHYNFAASVQDALNRAAAGLIRWLQRETRSRNLCVAGGVGLNCVMNQHLLGLDEIDRVWVQPASSDAGTALGAAYVVARQEGETIAPFPGAKIGNEFTPDAIRSELSVLGAPFVEIGDPVQRAAEAISQGKIVGWFQGRHEFGPRALGARSILADPRRGDMKDRINIRVKFREEFRPFAPSVLEESAADYFVIHGQTMPYMAITSDVRAEKQSEIPAVTHVDGTARIQTVAATDALYHSLISRVGSLTGTPVVLNTSFNVKGQPIVNTPTHAVGTFYGSGMDVLFMGPFMVEKPSA